MSKINGLCVGESLVGEGNEVAHIDLIMGPRGSAAESAFAHALTNQKDGFTSLLAVLTPNLLCKPATVLITKVTIKGAKQAVQMFGPAQAAVAKAVADSVAEGVIPADEAENLFICAACSSTGKLPTTRRSTTTTIAPRRKQLSGRSRASRRCPKSSPSAIRSSTRLPPRHWPAARTGGALSLLKHLSAGKRFAVADDFASAQWPR